METELQIIPISHATMVLNFGGKIIYTDPAEGLEALAKQPEADLILITDIHGDHFKLEDLKPLVKEKTMIVAPQAVVDLLTEDLKAKTTVMANGETKEVMGFKIEAVPMYNLPETEGSFHPKGRGNGYVVEKSGKRIYISGDTSATPEMKALQNIDVAFLCMNLPYTMKEEEAAEAVLALKPKQAIPYHYRGQGGFSDTEKFKELVNKGDNSIKVELINFYPNT